MDAPFSLPQDIGRRVCSSIWQLSGCLKSQVPVITFIFKQWASVIFKDSYQSQPSLGGNIAFIDITVGTQTVFVVWSIPK